VIQKKEVRSYCEHCGASSRWCCSQQEGECCGSLLQTEERWVPIDGIDGLTTRERASAKKEDRRHKRSSLSLFGRS
jgi:hypothetical protein